MKWVLRSREKKGPANYVARPGSQRSYTTRENARRFDTREAAEREACGNEIAIQVEA